MSKDKIEVSIKDISVIIEQLEQAEKEIEFERKSKNLFIDNLYKVCEMSLKQSQEIERLHSIIKEVREYIEMCNDSDLVYTDIMYKELLEILDKVD